MFDIGIWELLVIGTVALVVVGPKDLPKLMRSVAQWMRAARRMAGEFQRHVDDVMRESELDELRREVNALRNPKNFLLGSESKPKPAPVAAPVPAPPENTIHAPKPEAKDESAP